MPRRLVIVESPFRGRVKLNKLYLKRCIKDCISRGENPYASHGFLTHYLNDKVPEERRLGIHLGNQWREVADYTVFYVDLGWSIGMKQALSICKREGHIYRIRRLDGTRAK